MAKFRQFIESFEQQCDQVNGGKPYSHGVPPPCSYRFADYKDAITNGTPMCNVVGDTTSVESMLTPIPLEDMARYAADDVVAVYPKIHKGVALS